MLTLVLGSDLQCGRPYRPEVARAFHAAATALEPDVVVIAGDLTQRAKAHEFREARGLIDGFADVPVVVTPGNHDVPLYRFWERVASPYRNWRRFIAPALDTATRVPGAVVVALNSSAPRRKIVGGRIGAAQVEFAGRVVQGAAPDDVRILVIHHHFVPVPDGEGGAPLPNAAELLERFESMGVDLIVGGHVHQTHVTTSRVLVPRGPGSRAIPLVRCGTTTSNRGRGAEVGRNSFASVHVSPDAVAVTPHFFEPEAGRFEPGEGYAFPRGAAADARSDR